MKYIVSLCILLVLSCKNDTKANVVSEDKAVAENVDTKDITLEIYDFNGLEKYLHQEDDKIHVVNFWATWCAPCVKELPYFEKLNKNYRNKDVEVILVSLDFPSQYETKLKPFIKEHDLQSKILVLDDVDQNTWIPKVNKNWGGAIPITLIYNKDKRQFYERTFTYEELETELKQFLK